MVYALAVNMINKINARRGKVNNITAERTIAVAVGNRKFIHDISTGISNSKGHIHVANPHRHAYDVGS